jgi:DNA invertase Pin-like site-specific DNA recombinase
MTEHAKISPAHLKRIAIVYLRQSSDRQVRQNTESTRLQYGLQERARTLGWSNIEVIDEDLGSSASLGAAPRAGFDRLIAAVARSEVGVIFSREVSRLSRTNRDWCHLMEICQVFDTLLADDDHVYDLGSLDDQLVLGIKGTLSVIELKVLRLRLQQGMQAKAARGELVRMLPAGYVKDPDRHVAKDPDARVQHAIGLVFEVYRKTWSIRQTHQWFHHEGVELPVRRQRRGGVEQVWQLPTHSFVDGVLRNPCYAGAYVWGRHPTQLVVEDGRVCRRRGGRREPEDCRVFIRDHHEGYISWDQYEEHRRMRGRNVMFPGRDTTVAAVRKGAGLLGGLLRCSRCGRRMRVRYSGKHGTAARYLCVGDYPAGGHYCIAFGGATVDRRFGSELMAVLSPLGVEASLLASEQVRGQDDQVRVALSKQLEQLRYETRRAFEQYDAVDARNRLVAAELERRWNVKLGEAAALETEMARLDAEPKSLCAEDREAIGALGRHFETVWASKELPAELRKKIAHTVIEEVLVDVDDEKQRLNFVIHWKGGCHTRFEMDKPCAGAGQRTKAEDLEIIAKLAPRYGDGEIARVLSRLGRRTGKGNRWNQQRVKDARKRAGIAGRSRNLVDPDVFTLNGAARQFDVSDTTIMRLAKHGLLTNHQEIPWAPWEIHRAQLESQPVRGILEHLRSTGRLVLEGYCGGKQRELFQ